MVETQPNQIEQLIELDDPEVGLKGFIAIHTTKPGSALGATRMYEYNSIDDAKEDAMRLAVTMTRKCAIANLPHGGAKAVLIGSPQKNKNPALLKRYAEYVESLRGEFITGEDVGMYLEDVAYMQQFSKYFIGSSNKAGDSSPFAALSVFFCMQESLNHVFGQPDLYGKTVVIKGLGKTGLQLAKLIINHGGKVIGSDINPDAIKAAKILLPEISIIPINGIYSVNADVFAPCALGDDVSLRTLDVLKPKIICGVANNQLESKEVADLFHKEGFLYIPDYLANAGGLIDVADELEFGGYKKERVLKRIDEIKETCRQVLEISKKENIAPYRITDNIVTNRLNKVPVL